MSIHKKTLLIIGGATITLVLLLITTSHVFVLKGFIDLELENTQVNMHRVIGEMSNQKSRIATIAGDWAPWDATYKFIQEKNEDYIENNLSIEAITNLEVNFMLFFNPSGHLTYETFVDLSHAKKVQAPDALIETLLIDNSFIRHDQNNSKKTGFIFVNGMPIFVASHPIVKSDYSGPILGTLVVGKYADSSGIKSISETVRLPIEVQEVKEKKTGVDPSENSNLIIDGHSIVIRHEGKDWIFGHILFKDIHGKPAFILKIKLPRKIYLQGRNALLYYSLSIIGIGFFYTTLVVIFLKKIVLSPLSRLSTDVSRIGKTAAFHESVWSSKNDELGILANEINLMLQQINQNSIELAEIHMKLMKEGDERKIAEKKILDSDRRLRDQNIAILSLTKKRLYRNFDLKSNLNQITETASNVLEVERLSVWLYDDNRLAIKCIELFEISSRKHSEGGELHSDDYPKYFEALNKERIIAANDAHTDPRTEEFSEAYSTPLGISSMLDAQIRIGRQTVGVLCAEHTGSPRIWTIDEQSFIASIADIISLTIESHERNQAEQQRKKLEAQLQRVEKMEVIGTLAGGVAHDLNNILSGIIGYPELLLIDIPEDSKMRKPLLTIKKSGEKASAIVQDLLTLTRRGVPVTEVVNLNLIISEYLESPEHDKVLYYNPEVRVKFDFEVDLLSIIGSPVHLSKTVMNLITNAAEAMPQGGNITIVTENKYIESPVTGYDNIEKGDYVVLSVSDTGIGISPKDREKIFEPFYTKKVMGKSGTGLGMAVVWGTIKDHKGYIDIQSVEGEGTTFRLYFPVTRAELSEKQSQKPIEEYLGNGESVLVVDDIEEQREIAGNMLQKLGYQVSTASGGEEAVEYLKNNSVDLIILDMIMAPGIDGLDTYKKIIEIHPKQKTVIASGYSETERVKEAQKLGAGTYIKKPYTFEKIGVTVKTELNK